MGIWAIFVWLNIAHDGIIYLLKEGEVLIADGGYRGEEKNWLEGHNKSLATLESAARARDKTVNSRLKKFRVLQ